MPQVVGTSVRALVTPALPRWNMTHQPSINCEHAVPSKGGDQRRAPLWGCSRPMTPSSRHPGLPHGNTSRAGEHHRSEYCFGNGPPWGKSAEGEPVLRHHSQTVPVFLKPARELIHTLPGAQGLQAKRIEGASTAKSAGGSGPNRSKTTADVRGVRDSHNPLTGCGNGKAQWATGSAYEMRGQTTHRHRFQRRTCEGSRAA